MKGPRIPVLLFLFAVSGGSALIYEVVWTRLFTIVIGNTVFSVSAILAVFMAGLAFGSRIAGRLLDRKRIPLIASYAAIEGGIGLYNLVLPVFIKATGPLFRLLYSAAYRSFLLLGAGRLAISFLVLIVPATLMGATLPIVIRIFTTDVESVGIQSSRVYAANTFGAAVGAAAAGFVMIPHFGVMLTLYVAAALNLCSAPMVFFFGGTEKPHVMEQAPMRTSGPRMILAAMFLSGIAALMNELAWTRVLALLVGPTTYAFTLMLCAMIAGLGFGAAAAAYLTRFHDIDLNVFAWTEIGIGFASLALMPAFDQLPLWIAILVRRYSGSFGLLQSMQFLMFFTLMIVPTFLLGTTFPIAAKLYTQSDSLLGTEISAVYGFNTVGGIVGSILAGFLLLPSIGSQNTLFVAALLSTAAGIVLAARKRWLPVLVGLITVPAVFFMPKWNPALMTAGAYKYAPYYSPNSDVETNLASGELLYFREGATTTVSVKKFRGDVSLSVDGKVDATDAGDMVTQKLLAHIPLLLHKSAKNVAVIGLGSGVTAGAALSYPIEHLDIVEISPEVIDASRFFLHVNHNPLGDPRTELIIGDGRNHLRYAARRYDIIISEPSNPWMSGMASLFTQEFFKEARSKLTPSGIHCQWLHGYNMSLDDFKSIVRTFRTEFPYAALWTLTDYDFLLLGSPSPLTIDAAVLQQNFARVAGDLKEVKIQDLYSIVSLLSLHDGELDKFATNAALNTDVRPILEFSAPRFVNANTTTENIKALSAVHISEEDSYVHWLVRTPSADNHRHKGEMFLVAEAFEQARREFEEAIILDANDSQVWKELIDTDRGPDRAGLHRFVEDELASHPTKTVHLAAAELYSRENDHAKAVELLDAVLKSKPDDIEVLKRLAEALNDQGNPRLKEITERLLSLSPNDAIGLYHLATILLYEGRADEAMQAAKRSLEVDPDSARARNLLAIVYGQTFQLQLAEDEFQRVVKEFPDDWISYNNYGLFLLEHNRLDEARAQFAHAIRLNPDNAQAFVGIGETLRQAGSVRAAQIWYSKALRLEPNHPVARQYIK